MMPLSRTRRHKPQRATIAIQKPGRKAGLFAALGRGYMNEFFAVSFRARAKSPIYDARLRIPE
jgi:hypothetical protein